jgi:hypothetical protein
VNSASDYELLCAFFEQTSLDVRQNATGGAMRCARGQATEGALLFEKNLLS